MSTLKNVANKLFKVELSSIKEVKEAINAIKNMDQDVTKVIESYEKKISEAAAAYDVVMKERNAIYSWVMTSAPSIISDFESKAKDLFSISKSIILLIKLSIIFFIFINYFN